MGMPLFSDRAPTPEEIRAGAEETMRQHADGAKCPQCSPDGDVGCPQLHWAKVVRAQEVRP